MQRFSIRTQKKSLIGGAHSGCLWGLVGIIVILMVVWAILGKIGQIEGVPRDESPTTNRANDSFEKSVRLLRVFRKGDYSLWNWLLLSLLIPKFDTPSNPTPQESRNRPMSVESFVLLRVENREVTGVAPSVLNPEQAIVTVQSQGVYMYNVRTRLEFVLFESVLFQRLNRALQLLQYSLTII